jgi:hypothetical protein
MNISYYDKYLKYKNKYNILKKKYIGGSEYYIYNMINQNTDPLMDIYFENIIINEIEPSIKIFESNTISSDLVWCGAGVPNIVYHDTKLNVIIKIEKNNNSESHIPFIQPTVDI